AVPVVRQVAADAHLPAHGKTQVWDDADVDAAGPVLDGESLVEGARRERTRRDGDRSLDGDEGAQQQRPCGADVDRMGGPAREGDEESSGKDGGSGPPAALERAGE